MRASCVCVCPPGGWLALQIGQRVGSLARSRLLVGASVFHHPIPGGPINRRAGGRQRWLGRGGTSVPDCAAAAAAGPSPSDTPSVGRPLNIECRSAPVRRYRPVVHPIYADSRSTTVGASLYYRIASQPPPPGPLSAKSNRRVAPTRRDATDARTRSP